jgi:DNA-binding NtrC family response regulator
VPLLVAHFPRRFAPDRPLRLSPEAERALVNYDWPGNVRELRNVVQRIALFADGEIGPSDLPPEIAGGQPVEQLVRGPRRRALGLVRGAEEASMGTMSMRRVYVWELPVRLYHWVNALCVAVLAATGFLIGRPIPIAFSGEAWVSYWFG